MHREGSCLSMFLSVHVCLSVSHFECVKIHFIQQFIFFSHHDLPLLSSKPQSTLLSRWNKKRRLQLWDCDFILKYLIFFLLNDQFFTLSLYLKLIVCSTLNLKKCERCTALMHGILITCESAQRDESVGGFAVAAVTDVPWNSGDEENMWCINTYYFHFISSFFFLYLKFHHSVSSNFFYLLVWESYVSTVKSNQINFFQGLIKLIYSMT